MEEEMARLLNLNVVDRQLAKEVEELDGGIKKEEPEVEVVKPEEKEYNEPSEQGGREIPETAPTAQPETIITETGLATTIN